MEPGLYGENSADEFWFDRKLGFCEHIASAYVILMRALGVPARVVTGYQEAASTPWMALDGAPGDAHAWAEIWEPGQGWRRVDPPRRGPGAHRHATAPGGTPGRGGGRVHGRPQPTVLAQLRAGWEALNNRWNQWILTTARAASSKLLKNIGFETPVGRTWCV